jgi:hypothetical protein
MKKFLLFALWSLLPLVKPATADDGATYSIIQTNSGKVYTNCSVYKKYPDHVVLEFENGGATVYFADLSSEVREMLGYDPQREAAYTKERAEKNRRDQEAQETLAKYRAKTAKVQAKAARNQFAGMQGGYDDYAGGVPYPYGYPYAVGYSMGYPSDRAGHYSNHGSGVGSVSSRCGDGGSLNSRYTRNGVTGIGSIGYGNGSAYGLGACRIGQVNGHAGGNGNSFNGHNAVSRASCAMPQVNVIARPAYNFQSPCRVPVATPAIRFSAPSGGCLRR